MLLIPFKILNIDKNRKDTDPISDAERTQLRAIIGQLNWIAGMSRPDLSFDVCKLSSNIKKAKVSHMLYAYKVVKHVQMEPLTVAIPSLNLSILQ